MWHVPAFVVSLFEMRPHTFVAELVGRIRVLGVLQRLALCYGVGATLGLYLSRRALVMVSAVILLVYWWILWAFDSGTELYALQTNAALRFDLWLMGRGLHHGERVNGARFAFDPEGVLSTLPAVVTFVMGYLVGAFLDRTQDRRHAVAELLPAAVLLIGAGLVWDSWFGFPINKKLWTSSFVLYAAGWSTLARCRCSGPSTCTARRRCRSSTSSAEPAASPTSPRQLARRHPLPHDADGSRDGQPINSAAAMPGCMPTRRAMALAGDNGPSGRSVFAVGFTCW